MSMVSRKGQPVPNWPEWPVVRACARKYCCLA